MNKQIETENLLLLACDKEALECAIEGNQLLAKYLKVKVPENWTEFGARALKYALDKIISSESEQGWWTYFPIHKDDKKLIGSCGYKGSPDMDVVVEIGYEIATNYRNKGLAIELANALIKNAFANNRVKSIQAHTSAEINASTKVLTKCGLNKIEEIDAIDNGKLWKWELKKV